MATVDANSGLCRVRLWDGTLIDGPECKYSEELSAFCDDFTFVIDTPTIFEMQYDSGSFSEPLMLWLESEFEPAVNCIAKRSLLTITREPNEAHDAEDRLFSFTVQKNEKANSDQDQIDDEE